MRKEILVATMSILMLTGGSAWADYKSQAAMAKTQSKPVLDQLKKALDTAQQEEVEGDWDECVRAIKRAKLPRK